MHGGKILLPLFLTALVVASSGCISDPTAFARAIPMIQDFLDEYPNADISIVHYSELESQDVLDQVKEDCGKLTVEAKEYYFVNITDPSTGLVVRAWIDWENQIVECVFKEGIIVDPENCTSLHRSACFGDHVYWYDSCGNREDKKEYCPLGCSNGECREGRVCETETSYREKPNCSCPDGYEMVVLYLRCANSITGAITGMPFVMTETTAQKAVQTESGSVQISPEFTTDFEMRCPGEGPVYRCVKRERCRSHAQSMCYKGHVFWFDSCGHVQEKKEYCEEGCEQGFCKGRRTCEEMGGYCIYPTGCTEEARVCPDGTTVVSRTLPNCEFAPCPSEGSGGGGSTDSVTGMVSTETTSTSVCREGYEKASYYCPNNGVCCVPEKEKCAAEGQYTSGAVAPEYQYGCCEGLEAFYPWPEQWVGGGSLCYDPQKGIPVCTYAGTEEEGWYYPTGELLLLADCNEAECVDSDGGKDYYVKGEISTPYDENSDGYIIEGEGYAVDRCASSTQLNEYYCENNRGESVGITCPNGCEDGACIKIYECTDSDGGMSLGVIGTISIVDEYGESTVTEECEDEETINECYCAPSLGTPENNYGVNEFGTYECRNIVCPNGCQNGVCNTSVSGCYDSDNGKDYFTYGYVSDGMSYLPDECADNGMQLHESYCENGQYKDEVYSCPNGCEDGACIELECRDENYQCSIEDIACCAGLVEVPMAGMENGTCIAATCGSICRLCGNGVCEDNENVCTCPEDCG